MGTPAAERDLRRQGKRTMGRLLGAGRRVFATKGYASARVDDIVAEAGTSHGTFYLYFSNKEDLFRALAEECTSEMTKLTASLDEVPTGPEGVEVVRTWLEHFFATYQDYGAIIRAWMESHITDDDLMDLGLHAFRDIGTVLVDRIQSGNGRALDDGLAAAAMLSMIERTFYLVTAKPFDLDDQALLDTMATLVHRGFFGGRAAA